MKFENPLIHGTLVKRYKRFLSDIRLNDGTLVVAHCTNTGSMKSCLEEGAEVYISPAQDPKRKTKFTWEMIKINNGWIGINTMLPNQIVAEAILNQEIKNLSGYTEVKREVKIGNSRIDILATNQDERCYIEVKNVSMRKDNIALFPDAVTSRGKKHLEELITIKENGHRAVMVFLIQRSDVDSFAPAKEIDTEYAITLKKAFEKGVEIIPLMAKVSPHEIKIQKVLSFKL